MEINPASPPERTLRKSIREDGICVLTLDRPGSSANIFDRQALVELEEELDQIAGATGVRGLVIVSAKKSIFVAGADLKTLSESSSDKAVEELIELGQSVMNKLAGLTIPTVAAIHGAAVGGGYELCLACDYRVASNDKSTKIGLPETQIGLLPAWGGATRLPRLIGLARALDLILPGKTVAAKQALKRGMIDDVVPAEYVLERAISFVSRGKRKPTRHLLVNNRVFAMLARTKLRKQLFKKTRGHYPAADKALDVVTRGISRSIEESLRLERDAILELASSEACHNLLRIFFMQEKAKKQAPSKASTSGAVGGGSKADKPVVTQAAVIGAGLMGAGIAQWLSSRKVRVLLRDLNAERVAAGLGSISKIYQDGVKRHVFTKGEARDGMDRIYPAPNEVPLKNLELIIEAAVENFELKQKIFQRLDELAGDQTILATNTSALPISELAAGTRKPERVVGLHFFNPVHRMQLVEIVAARQTSPEVLERAVRFVQQIGKLPVVVKDSPGFLVNRILMPYLLEAGTLFESGASIKDLDEAMLDFGMPMGPMRLLDEVGIDVAMHVAQTLASSFKERMVLPQTLGKMAAAGALGRKVGRGFYLHRKGKEAVINPQPLPGSPEGIAGTVGSAAGLSRAELQERMVLLMVNESARCLEEGIVNEPENVDFAMIMGTGFAPFRGGPLRYADTVGILATVRALDRWTKAGAKHFEPCRLLRKMAGTSQKFYSETGGAV